MTATFTSLRDRVEQMLMDSSNAIFPTTLIDEGIRQALEQYSGAYPRVVETEITLSADGREISLSTLTGLLEVLDVWYPYSSTGSEVFPPNEVIGWRVYWDDSIPKLYIHTYQTTQPQSGEKVRIWYSTIHNLNGLDAQTTTTIRSDHEYLLVIGAAAKAAMSRAADLIETANLDLYEVNLLGSWALLKDKEFTNELEKLRRQSARFGPQWPIASGAWKLDKWDRY
jgi:hypothetical protein